MTSQIVGSPPPRFQLVRVPSVWPRPEPCSKDGFNQKLFASRPAWATRVLLRINSALKQNRRSRTFIIFPFDLISMAVRFGVVPNGRPPGIHQYPKRRGNQRQSAILPSQGQEGTRVKARGSVPGIR